MSTITISYPSISRDRKTPAIGLMTILVITSLALIAGAILVIVLSPNRDVYQTDPIPVSHSSLPVVVPARIPPIADMQPIPSETPSPTSGVTSEQFVVPVPVPTAPSQ